ncbi:MAG: tetratricopeptide repeat protein [Verrucomicrobiota bacterium]
MTFRDNREFFRKAISCFLLIICCSISLRSQGVDPAEKTQKYYDALLKRPAAGRLYDKFYETWLDHGTVKGLENFLKQKISSSNEDLEDRKLLLAFFYLKTGEDNLALKLFEEVAKLQPDDAGTWYEKALLEAKNLDFDSAIKSLESIKQESLSDQDAIKIERLKGKLYARIGENERALELWESIAETYSNDPSVLEDLVDLQVKEGFLDQAIISVSKLIEQTSDVHQRIAKTLQKAELLNRAGEKEKSLKIYSESLKQIEIGSWLEKEICEAVEKIYRQEQDLNGLKKFYRNLLDNDKQRVSIKERYAQVLLDLNQGGKALEVVEEILEIMPGERSYREKYVEILGQMGRHRKAIEVLNGLLDSHAADGELWVRLSELQFQNGDKRSAGEALDRYLEVSDKSEYVYLRVAKLLEEFDLKSRAGEVYEKLIEVYPYSLSARGKYASYLYENGGRDEAVTIWKEMISQGGRSELISISGILSAQGEHELAYDFLKERIDEYGDDVIYLGLITQEARFLKKWDEALPWAIKKLELSRGLEEIRAALTQVSFIISRSRKIEQTIESLKSKPSLSIQERALLAEMYAQEGALEDAEEVLEDLKSKDIFISLGLMVNIYARAQNWEKAAIVTEEMIEHAKGRRSFYLEQLIGYYQKASKWEKALSWVRELKKISPNKVEPWLQEVQVLGQLDRTEKAIEILQKAVGKYQNDVSLRAKLAEVFTTSGNSQRAVEIYWELFYEAEDAEAKLQWVRQMANAVREKRGFEELIKRFESLHLRESESVLYILSLAELYKIANEPIDYRNALEKAIKLDPKNQALKLELASFLETEGLLDNALSILEEISQKDKSANIQKRLSRLYFSLGYDEKGFEVLKNIAGNDEMDEEAIELIANARVSSGDWQGAIEFLKSKLQKFPNDYRLRFMLAVAYVESLEKEKAIEQFLRLLEVKDELARVKVVETDTPGSYRYEMIRSYAKLLPEVTNHLLTSRRHSDEIFKYKANNRSTFNQPVSAQSYGLTLPVGVKMLRVYTMAHIQQLAKDMSSERRSSLVLSLGERGVERSELWVNQVLEGMQPNWQLICDIIVKNPQDRALLGLFAVYGKSSNLGNKKCYELGCQVYEVFREESIQMAFLGALNAALADSRGNKLLAEVLSSDKRINKPNLLLTVTLPTVLGALSSQNKTSYISLENRIKLKELMLNWYNNVDWEMLDFGARIMVYVAQALAHEEDYETLISFLDDEAKRFSRPNIKSNLPNYFQRIQQQKFLGKLNFPPGGTKELPEFMLILVDPPSVRTSTYLTLKLPKSKVDILKHVDKTQNPYLRILLVRLLEDDSLTKSEVDKLLLQESPSLDDYLWSAAFASYQDRHVDALNLYREAKKKPINAMTKAKVDQAIVFSLLEMDKEKVTDSDLEIGQLALQSLSRKMNTKQETDLLLKAMQSLGLKDEAQKYKSRLAISSSPLANISATSRSPARQPNSLDKVKKYLNEKKGEHAVDVAASELRSLSQKFLSNGGKTNQTAKQLQQELRKKGLVKDVLEKLKPSIELNFKQLAILGAAHELMEEDSLALDYYQKALKINPDQVIISLRVAMMSLRDNKETARGIINQFDRDSFYIVSNDLETYFNHNRKISYLSRIELIEMLTCRLQAIELLDGSWKWVRSVFNVLERSYNQDGIELPQLSTLRGMRGEFTISSKSGSESIREKAQKLSAVRLETYEKLCRVMLNNPEMSLYAFEKVCRLILASERPRNELPKMAQEALLLAKRNWVYQNYSRKRSHDALSHYTPIEYLALHAYRENNWDFLTNEVIPSLRKEELGQMADLLEAISELYQVEEYEFARVAQDFVRKSFPGNSIGMHYLDIVTDIWSERQFKMDLSDTLLVGLEQRNRYWFKVPYGVIEHCLEIYNREGREALSAMLDSIALEYMDQGKNREKFLNQYLETRGRTHGSPGHDIYLFASFIEELAGYESISLFAYHYLDSISPKLASNHKGPIINNLVRRVPKQSDEVISFLINSELLRLDLDRMRLYRIQNANKKTLVSSILGNIQRAKENEKESVIVALSEAAEKDSSFGLQFALAYLKDKSGESLLELFTLNSESLAGLPSEQKNEWILAIRDLLPKDIYDTELSEDSRDFLAWLKKQKTEG